MIVLDASAALELLLRGPLAAALEMRLFDANEALHAPHLIDLEVAQVLRRHTQAGLLSATEGEAALAVWRAIPIARHGHDLLLPRVWELRSTLTAYDATYVALAEALDGSLVTTDAKLAAPAGHGARVEVVSG